MSAAGHASRGRRALASRHPLAWLLALTFSLLTGRSADADWTAAAGYRALAEVAVGEHGITVDLRASRAELPALQRLVGIPDAPTASPELVMPRLLRLTAGGIDLVGRSQENAESSPTVPEQHQAATDSAGIVEMRLSYPALPRGAVLRLTPPDGAAGKDIGLIVLDRGVPVSDPFPLHKPELLRFSATDPWASSFADPAHVRTHNAPRSYLYVEPFEVRHELLSRLDDLDLELSKPGVRGEPLDAAARDRLKQRLAAHIVQHSPLSIDGQQTPARIDRVAFVRFSRNGVEPIPDSAPLDLRAAMLGVVLVYLTPNPTQTLDLRWELFGRSKFPRGVSVILGRESFDALMTPNEPRFDWRRDEALDAEEPDHGALEVPRTDPIIQTAEPRWISVGAAVLLLLALPAVAWLAFRERRAIAGLGLAATIGGLALLAPIPRGELAAASPDAAPHRLDERTATELIAALLHNAHRAFELAGEKDSYDRLAISLDGPLLDQVYLQQRRALLAQAHGLGGEGKVSRVDVQTCTIESLGRQSPAYRIDARWTATGTVSHWGHSHERRNAYHARLTLSPDTRGRWKITAMDFLDTRFDGGGAA
ncbi:MAG: hypothetical protein U1E83_08465 [Methylotetracoccus sp.]